MIAGFLPPSMPPASRISPSGSVVAVGYQRAVPMSAARARRLEAVSNIVASWMPALILPSGLASPPAISTLPSSGITTAAPQNRSTARVFSSVSCDDGLVPPAGSQTS